MPSRLKNARSARHQAQRKLGQKLTSTLPGFSAGRESLPGDLQLFAKGQTPFGVQWRVADIKVIEVPAPINKDRYKTTYQIEPRAMATDFDDSQWERIEGKDLGVRRSGGHNAFMWFRGLLINKLVICA